MRASLHPGTDVNKCDPAAPPPVVQPPVVQPPSPSCLASAPSATGTLTIDGTRSEEHTSELQSQSNLVCRLLLEKKKNKQDTAALPTYISITGICLCVIPPCDCETIDLVNTSHIHVTHHHLQLYPLLSQFLQSRH